MLPRAILLLLSACLASAPALGTEQRKVIDTYANIAHAVYQDAHAAAIEMQSSIEKFLLEPNQEALEKARSAWRQARVPYMQHEVFRFGNPIVDDWEAQLNSWPLDEGLIDYVNHEHYEHELGNPGAVANIVANQSITIGAETLDLSEITPQLLAELNEIGGSEANVATGYHAIEFLLWGQDLNGTAPGAGDRSYTDYLSGKACTHGNCERRAEYLRAVTELLVSDLAYMVREWAPNVEGNYRDKLVQLPVEEGMRRMFYGMGSLALGELAGERMKVALEANSTEDEHDCFSDNTHASHYFNGLGIENVYLGRYQRLDGSVVSGPSLSELVAIKDKPADEKLRLSMQRTKEQLQRIYDHAERKNESMKFDQMIAEDNLKGQKMIEDAIDALLEQTIVIEQVALLAGVESLTSDTAGHRF